MLTKRSINGNQHPSRSEITFLESHRFFPIGRSLFDLLLSEFEKTGVPVDLVRLGIEPKSDIDFPAGLINPDAAVLGANGFVIVVAQQRGDIPAHLGLVFND